MDKSVEELCKDLKVHVILNSSEKVYMGNVWQIFCNVVALLHQ